MVEGVVAERVDSLEGSASLPIVSEGELSSGSLHSYVEVKLSLEERHDLALKGGNESVVPAHVVAGALGSNASKVLVLARQEDLEELVVGEDAISVAVEVGNQEVDVA